MMAQVFKVKLTVLHVFEYVPNHRYPVPVGWMVEIIRRDVRNKLEEANNALRQSGIETETRMLEGGMPAQQILGFMQAYESPLLVMGTHAVAGMERFLLGSTAEEVLRQTKWPTITVGPHVVSGMESHAGVRRILFATDFSETSLTVIPFMLALQRSSGAQLRVLHVAGNHMSEKEENKQFDTVRNALQAAQGVEYVTLHGDNISQAVANEAERYPADLLVLGIRRATEHAAHLAPKIVFQIVAAAPCAVLTVAS